MDNGLKLVSQKRLKESDIFGEVVKINGEDDDKPSLVVLNDNEMVMFTIHRHSEYPSHRSTEQEENKRWLMFTHTIMYRTKDGGKTWECCGHMPFHNGHEPSATVIDGVIYVQTHELPNLYADHNNVIARIFCSEDKGNTWYETRLDSKYFGVSESAILCMDRNFIKLSDGSVAGFASVRDNGSGHTVRLTTTDHGRTWKQDPVTERGVYSPDTSATPVANSLTALLEAYFFRTPKTGRLMAVSRVFWSSIAEEQKRRIPHALTQDEHADIDSLTGMILLESKDEGLSWDPVRGLGYLSMMYPSVAYLDDEAFLFTYTVRSNDTDAPHPHMGMQAVLGRELPDGNFEFNFDNDIIVIDDRTPDYSENGNGFGMTYRLSDGSLITPYSYRVNAPALDKILRDKAFNDEGVFMKYYQKTKLNRTHIPSIDHYRNASNELRRHMITILAEERMESFLQTEVLRWNLNY